MAPICNKAHLDALVTELQTSGRRVGNVQRQDLSPRSINLMLTLLSSVLEDAVRQGQLSRNVAKMVERPHQTKKEMQTWTAGEASAFLAAVAGDRLAAAWQLSMYGLRRGEVLGLCWSDIDWQAKTLTIRRARVEAWPTVMEGPPKTDRSRRTLPLDDGLIAALRSMSARQAEERVKAGSAYSPGCGDCSGRHVVVDELGHTPRPEWFSHRFKRLFKDAGLPVYRLHDARHTSVTLMILNGVPIPVVSAWHGHASAAFTVSVYAHSQPDALTAAGALYGSLIRASGESL
jgi:integrase